MFYLVYKITNKVNGKIYIGVHRTLDINDDYMGSGKVIKQAILKYGVDSFTKEILYVFDNLVDMFKKEREIVNEEFVNDQTTYNLLIGGKGGFSKESTKVGREKTNQILREKHGDNWRSSIGQKGNSASLSTRQQKHQTDSEYRNKMLDILKLGNVAALSDESKQKRKETMRKNGHSQGEKNNRFGTMWIYNPDTKESKTIIKDTIIPDGWIKGRKIKK